MATTFVRQRQLPDKVVFDLLESDHTLATVLHIIALAQYGDSIYDLDPVELYMRLEEDYHARITDGNESKLNSIMLATSTDIFYEDPEAFRGICSTLMTGDPDIEQMEPLTVPEVVWGVYEVEANHGEHPLSASIQKVIDSVLEEESEELQDEDKDGVRDLMAERRHHLIDQLERLKLPTDGVPPLNPVAA